ncbi:heme oxygenase 2a isoform X1 [Danio rerio]|uniref:Heme oxygenase n=6 Tax=Danio rerio TaxID=7955 RepID=A7MD59_DANRE|nr:heme oxygenase 2a [Danio rerio]XP_009294701.1 heme oxygenase 2 isoform X1 [Danio rerio]AAI52490.1 Si:dkey-44g23.7 protein [Danio rerio]|eukprot:NP_001096609.1 heme oxygenase 2 [Danio rerio]
MAADSAVSNGGENILTDSDDDILNPNDLSEVLAAGTKESHDKAENSPFVKDFLRGRIKRELFKLGTTALYYVYSAIEEEIEKVKDHAVFAPLYFPSELHRQEALAKDLAYFYGEDWESQISCSAATQPYVDRIHEVGRDDPVLLVAHAWTRYMGDLSGGQILKKVAQRALKLPPTGEGLNFYHFEGIHNPTAFKRLYRSRMNELEVDAETKAKLLDEANLAFKLNLDVFTELQEIGKDIEEEVQDIGPHAHGDMGGDISKCPYYAAKMAVSGNTTYACNFAKTVLRQSTVQVILATLVAAVAGLAAWYLM